MGFFPLLGPKTESAQIMRAASYLRNLPPSGGLYEIDFYSNTGSLQKFFKVSCIFPKFSVLQDASDDLQSAIVPALEAARLGGPRFPFLRALSKSTQPMFL